MIPRTTVAVVKKVLGLSFPISHLEAVVVRDAVAVPAGPECCSAWGLDPAPAAVAVGELGGDRAHVPCLVPSSLSAGRTFVVKSSFLCMADLLFGPLGLVVDASA